MATILAKFPSGAETDEVGVGRDFALALGNRGRSKTKALERSFKVAQKEEINDYCDAGLKFQTKSHLVAEACYRNGLDR